jgi:hypothetical protein
MTWLCILLPLWRLNSELLDLPLSLEVHAELRSLVLALSAAPAALLLVVGCGFAALCVVDYGKLMIIQMQDLTKKQTHNKPINLQQQSSPCSK